MDEQLNTDLRFSIVPEWVLDADVSDRAVRLYTVLARYADNETLQAFPSRETLAKRCRCHTKSIDRAIDELVLLGAIVKRHRKANNGYQSNIYTLRRVPTPQSPPRDSADARVGTPQSPPRDTGVELTITTELEPFNVEPLNIKEKLISPSSDAFDEWWDAYPLKKGKGAARAAYTKARKKVPADKLQGAVEIFRDDPNRGDTYLPHPTTWLNEERWDDEPYQEPGQKARKMTNAEQGALLAAQYRAEEQGQLESAGARNFELESEWGSMVRGVDDE